MWLRWHGALKAPCRYDAVRSIPHSFQEFAHGIVRIGWAAR